MWCDVHDVAHGNRLIQNGKSHSNLAVCCKSLRILLYCFPIFDIEHLIFRSVCSVTQDKKELICGKMFFHGNLHNCPAVFDTLLNLTDVLSRWRRWWTMFAKKHLCTCSDKWRKASLRISRRSLETRWTLVSLIILSSEHVAMRAGTWLMTTCCSLVWKNPSNVHLLPCFAVLVFRRLRAVL